MRKALAESTTHVCNHAFFEHKVRQLWCSHLASQLSLDRTSQKLDLEFGVQISERLGV